MIPSPRRSRWRLPWSTATGRKRAGLSVFVAASVVVAAGGTLALRALDRRATSGSVLIAVRDIACGPRDEVTVRTCRHEATSDPLLSGPSTSGRAIWTGSEHAADPEIPAMGVSWVHTSAYRRLLRALPDGVLSIAWLGGYDNEECHFRENRDWVTERVKSLRRHPKLAAWFIDDEPHGAEECPRVRRQLRVRIRLVKSLDPRHPTMLSENRLEAFDDLDNLADIFVVIRYPCSHDSGCDLSKIDESAAAAKAAGIRSFWAAPQVFTNDYYAMPAASELQEILDRWASNDAAGYMPYIWDGSTGENDYLLKHPELQEVLRAWFDQQSEFPDALPAPDAYG